VEFHVEELFGISAAIDVKSCRTYWTVWDKMDW